VREANTNFVPIPAMSSAAQNVVNNNDEFPPHLLHDSLRRKNVSSHQDAAPKIETLVPNAIYVVRDVLSPEECQDWITYTEDQQTTGGGRKRATWEGVSHPATKYIAHRECGRMQKIDWNMSHRLYRRIENIVTRISPLLNIADEKTLLANLVKKGSAKKSDPKRHKYRPITCNPNLRLYKYTKGQWFGRHVDGSDVIKLPPSSINNSCTTVDGIFTKLSVDDTKNKVDLQTEITVLFYLSTCKGGATRFHLPHGRKNSSVSFTPQVGAVLLHVHGDNCLEHEAEPVLEGVKYGE